MFTRMRRWAEVTKETVTLLGRDVRDVPELVGPYLRRDTLRWWDRNRRSNTADGDWSKLLLFAWAGCPNSLREGARACQGCAEHSVITRGPR